MEQGFGRDRIAWDGSEPPFSTIDLPPEKLRARALAQLEKVASGCVKCDLHQGRTQVVFGVGHPNADLMFIGEAPGHDEDAQGIPFVGRAGQLLTKIIEAIRMTRKQVYIGNIIKCRPPGNRSPTATEIVTCMPYLKEQIRLIQPRVICCLGAVAAQTLLQTKESITSLRGQFIDWQGTTVMATYHPAYLLRSYTVENRRRVWEDMKKVREYLKARGS
jgi:DNA polymerase